MNHLALTDPHCTSHQPRARLDNFSEAIFKKLDEVAKICKENKVEIVLIAGDMFDYPYQAYRILIKLYFKLKKIKENLSGPKLILCVYGQHDLWFHRLEEAVDTTALGALVRLGVVKILTDDPLKFKYKGERIHYYGSSYGEPIPQIKDVTATNVLVIHKMIAPRQPFKTAVEGKDYESPEMLYSKDWFDLVVCGDWHQQFYWRSKANTHIINPGALARKTGGYEDYDRHPTIVLWDSRDNEIDEILLESAKPSEEVLTKAHLETIVKHTEKMKNFCERLRAGGSSLGPGYLRNLARQLSELKDKRVITKGVESKILEAIEHSNYKQMLNMELENEIQRGKGESSKKGHIKVRIFRKRN